jgi:hypothetical protein
MMLFRNFCIAVFLGLMSFSTVQAATYRATFEFTPFEDPRPDYGIAEGNKLVIDWTTDIAVGEVRQYDLSFLEFTLYRDDTELFQDTVILDGIVQPLHTTVRDMEGIYFKNTAIEEPDSFFEAINHNFRVDVSVPYYLLYGYTTYVERFDVTTVQIYIDYYVDNEWDTSRTLYLKEHPTFSKVELSAVPVPAAVWMFGAGLMGLSLLRKRKKPGFSLSTFFSRRQAPSAAG